MPAAIVVDNVSKKFLIGSARYSSLRDVVARPIRRLLGRPAEAETARTREFWALKDVSFEVEKGTTLGIIGPNGAGKSTLLKLMSRVSIPTKGTITTHGRVSALIEVGAGFHPELTGRENVYLNGSILGMKKKEIDRKFDAIVDFSGLAQFIDTPIKHYSSGMYARLGFSVAAHVDPDILIVDEVLSVGDWGFQQKCFSRMTEIRDRGTTVIFVSHHLAAVTSLCSRCLMIDEGCLLHEGTVQSAVEAYSRAVSRKGLSQDAGQTGFIEVVRKRLTDEGNLERSLFAAGEEAKFSFDLRFQREIRNPIVGFTIRSDKQVCVWNTDTNMRRVKTGMWPAGCNVSVVGTVRLNLGPGAYYVGIDIHDEDPTVIHHKNESALPFQVDGDKQQGGLAFCPVDLRMGDKEI